MISQKYARHNECPSNSRTFDDRRYVRLIHTDGLIMAKFLQNFVNPNLFLSEIAPQKRPPATPRTLRKVRRKKAGAMKKPGVRFGPAPI